MPIPDTPYTRKEAYLNAAATGDTSGIPETPYTREEMYLDAIARNGGGGGGGGSSTLAGLTDVDISNPTDGQTLVYDAASSKWVNGSGGGGGGGGFTLLHGTYGTQDEEEFVTLPITASALYVLMQTSAVWFDYVSTAVADESATVLLALTQASRFEAVGEDDTYIFYAHAQGSPIITDPLAESDAVVFWLSLK